MTDNAEFLLEALVAISLVAIVAGFALLATWLDRRDMEHIAGPRWRQLAHQERERAVRCSRCGRWTWAHSAVCDLHEDGAA